MYGASKMKKKIADEILRKPGKYELSYREAVRRLYELGADEHDMIVLGKHPYYWMRLDEIKEAIDEAKL